MADIPTLFCIQMEKKKQYLFNLYVYFTTCN